MGRSLRTVCFGWSIGFAVALATAGLTNRTGNPRLSAALFAAAAALALLVALLVGSAAAAERLGRRRAVPTEPDRSVLTWPRRGSDAPAATARTPGASDPAPPIGSSTKVAAVVPADDDETVARIALLEARLALEEHQLRAAAEALAATDAEAAAHHEQVMAAEEVHPEAAELEAALRQELLDAVARLASTKQPDGATADPETLREAG